MKTFVGITGTTSVGKSDVAVQLAKYMGTEIISADSMQIYRGMDIGTAKLGLRDMQGVVHHMIDVADPNENFSSFLYREQAAKIIDAMPTIPIVVGGTGFYFDNLVYPPEYGNPSQERRAELLSIYEQQGIEPLQKMLAEKDEQAAKSVDIHNYKRVIRAIEIAESGSSISCGHTKFNPQYNMVLFVLQSEREQLYIRIEKRVDEMISNGLVAEVKSLVAKYGYCDTPAFQAIGYKEIVEYLKGNIDLDEAICRIKLNTRHYAKRQISYYKRMNVTEYINIDGESTDEIAQYIYTKVKNLSNIIE